MMAGCPMSLPWPLTTPSRNFAYTADSSQIPEKLSSPISHLSPLHQELSSHRPDFGFSQCTSMRCTPERQVCSQTAFHPFSTALVHGGRSSGYKEEGRPPRCSYPMMRGHRLRTPYSKRRGVRMRPRTEQRDPRPSSDVVKGRFRISLLRGKKKFRIPRI